MGFPSGIEQKLEPQSDILSRRRTPLGVMRGETAHFSPQSKDEKIVYSTQHRQFRCNSGLPHHESLKDERSEEVLTRYVVRQSDVVLKLKTRPNFLEHKG